MCPNRVIIFFFLLSFYIFALVPKVRVRERESERETGSWAERDRENDMLQKAHGVDVNPGPLRLGLHLSWYWRTCLRTSKLNLPHHDPAQFMISHSTPREMSFDKHQRWAWTCWTFIWVERAVTKANNEITPAKEHVLSSQHEFREYNIACVRKVLWSVRVSLSREITVSLV